MMHVVAVLFTFFFPSKLFNWNDTRKENNGFEVYHPKMLLLLLLYQSDYTAIF